VSGSAALPHFTAVALYGGGAYGGGAFTAVALLRPWRFLRRWRFLVISVSAPISEKLARPILIVLPAQQSDVRCRRGAA
jgi:hypothetical protein